MKGNAASITLYHLIMEHKKQSLALLHNTTVSGSSPYQPAHCNIRPKLPSTPQEPPLLFKKPLLLKDKPYYCIGCQPVLCRSFAGQSAGR